MRGLARQAARAKSLPPPVGGWNARDAIADMPETDAILLDNWFPGTDDVTLRGGSVVHQSMPSAFSAEFSAEFQVTAQPVETLMEYVPTSGVAKLLAAAGSSVYDVTTSGGTPVTLAHGVTSAEYVHAQIGTPAGHFLFAANGEDALAVYNGTTWAASGITGPTMANVAWVASHQKRLWLGEKQSLRAWYMAVETIAGAASSFDLSAVAQRGGFLLGMGTWTRDGGDGIDDLAVFFTSNGEAIVYQGTDPSSAATWWLVGVFRIGAPLNRRSWAKAGAELIALTQDGIIPVSVALASERSQAGYVALSRKIDKAFNQAVRATGVTPPNLGSGWQLILYPRGTMLVANVPVASGSNVQFVFNSITGAACRFTGLNANCWALLNDKLYFGSADGDIVEFDSGTGDMGSPIVGDSVQAFSYFGSPGQEKAFKRIEIVTRAGANPRLAVDVMTDFIVSNALTPLPSPVQTAAALWGSALWGSAVWGGVDSAVWRGWRSIRGQGRSATLRVRCNSLYDQPSWLATNWTYVPGGIL